MDNAKQTLIFYMKIVWEKAGLKWDGDNDAEMRQLIENIVEEVQKTTMQREDVEVILRQHGLIT